MSGQVEVAAALWQIVRPLYATDEEAEEKAAVIMLFAETELERIAPEFKQEAPERRAIAAAMYATVSKNAVKSIGREKMPPLFRAVTGYAEHSGEVDFYLKIGKSLRILS